MEMQLEHTHELELFKCFKYLNWTEVLEYQIYILED